MLHKVLISVPDGKARNARIEIDGQHLLGVTAFEVRGDVYSMVRLTLEMYVDVEISGEAEIVKEWRTAHLAREAALSAE